METRSKAAIMRRNWWNRGATLLALLATGPTLAAPAADPWVIRTLTDRMTGATGNKANTTIRDSGVDFDVDLLCMSRLSMVSLRVQPFGNKTFDGERSTTIYGSDVTGYSTDIADTLDVRLRLDQGSVINDKAFIPYSNVFVYNFPKVAGAPAGDPDSDEARQAKAQAERFAEIGKALAGIGLGHPSPISANDLLRGQVLRVQTTLGDGATPVLTLPLSPALKGFVSRCLFPEASPQAIAAARAAQEAARQRNEERTHAFNGTFSAYEGQAVLKFDNGALSYFLYGRLVAQAHYAFKGDRIDTDLNGGLDEINYIDANHIRKHTKNVIDGSIYTRVQ